MAKLGGLCRHYAEKNNEKNSAKKITLTAIELVKISGYSIRPLQVMASNDDLLLHELIVLAVESKSTGRDMRVVLIDSISDALEYCSDYKITQGEHVDFAERVAFLSKALLKMEQTRDD